MARTRSGVRIEQQVSRQEPAVNPSPRIEKIVAGFDFAAPLNQLQRSQPAQGVVETPAIRFVTGFGGNFLFSPKFPRL